jgi:hypothetical protein
LLKLGYKRRESSRLVSAAFEALGESATVEALVRWVVSGGRQDTSSPAREETTRETPSPALKPNGHAPVATVAVEAAAASESTQGILGSTVLTQRFVLTVSVSFQPAA